MGSRELAVKVLDNYYSKLTERASKINSERLNGLDKSFTQTLDGIDSLVQKEKDKFLLKNSKIGIENNFLFPSLTHYVLSQASNTEDLITVIMQLKADWKIEKVRKKINEETETTKRSLKFQNT